MANQSAFQGILSLCVWGNLRGILFGSVGWWEGSRSREMTAPAVVLPGMAGSLEEGGVGGLQGMNWPMLLYRPTSLVCVFLRPLAACLEGLLC